MSAFSEWKKSLTSWRRCTNAEVQERRIMNVQKVNYQKELERLLKELGAAERVPTLLIHS